MTWSIEPMDRCDAGIVLADRLDRVADELDAERLGRAGREEVDDAAADAELAVLVDGIFAGEPRVGEQLREIVRAISTPGQGSRRRIQRRVGWLDQPSAARPPRTRSPRVPVPAGAMERTSPGGCDAQVRREAAIGIDFV